jgi:hypothetical protein
MKEFSVRDPDAAHSLLNCKLEFAQEFQSGERNHQFLPATRYFSYARLGSGTLLEAQKVSSDLRDVMLS